MLEFYHPNRVSVLRKNTIAQFMEMEAVRLRSQGYSFNYARELLMYISYFGDWLKANRIKLKNIDKTTVTRFLEEFKPPTISKESTKPISGRPHLRAATLSVLDYVKKQYPESMQKTPIQREVYSFYHFLIDDKNIAVRTAERYKQFLSLFLKYFFEGKKMSMMSLTPRMIRNYIEQVPSSLDERKRKDTCSMLKNYFQYLLLKGKNVSELHAGIPSFQSKHNAPPAELLTTEELNVFLNLIDRTTAIGKRTYASVLCQTDIGMRIGDVAAIMLDDIDWRNGRILVKNNKSGKPAWLPLPRRVGDAIVDYLRKGRPTTNNRHVFVPHSRARYFPKRASYLERAIYELWKKSDLDKQFSGTRIFRHYAARKMKEKQCPVKVISDILGHSSLQVTAIYAKVDILSLRTVSQEWPNEEVSYEN